MAADPERHVLRGVGEGEADESSGRMGQLVRDRAVRGVGAGEVVCLARERIHARRFHLTRAGGYRLEHDDRGHTRVRRAEAGEVGCWRVRRAEVIADGDGGRLRAGRRACGMGDKTGLGRDQAWGADVRCRSEGNRLGRGGEGESLACEGA